MVKKSQILFTYTNGFAAVLPLQSTVLPLQSTLSFQNNLHEHVISLERGDFKLSIGSLNNKFPYTVVGLLNSLQSAQHSGER